MKLLHTSDWHVGKQIRGRSRAPEHAGALAEIASIAETEAVDLVLVAGDLFDTAAPSPESDELVFQTLLRFARTAQVAVITGNHDNARRLHALTPLLLAAGVQLVSAPTRADDGGVLRLTARDGTPIRVAMLPFVSQRGIVRAEHLMDAAAFQNAQSYSHRMALLIHHLQREFHADCVNILMAHAFVVGGAVGGGERQAHLVEEYAIPSPAFPATAGYVALGHLHRPQSIAGATSIHYCGSPIQLDFGEPGQIKQVNIVDLQPGLPAKVEPHPLLAGRALRTYTGTIDMLRGIVADDDAWLRLVITEPQRAGLGDEVREQFGDRVVEVRIEPPGGRAATTMATRRGRSPLQLFEDFMAEQGVADPRVAALFASLLEADLSEAADEVAAVAPPPGDLE